MGYFLYHRPCAWPRHTRLATSFQVNVVMCCKEVPYALAMHAGTAAPLHVSPPEGEGFPIGRVVRGSCGAL
jgi:hypothetical protein